MKRLTAIIATLLMLAVFLMPAPAQAEDCTINVNALGIGLVVCGGTVVDSLPLPKVTVTAPPVQLPAPPRATVTVRPPPQTITVPGPTSTVTVRVPGATKTTTTGPKTSQPSKLPAQPTQTSPAIPQPTPSRQVGPTTAIVETPSTVRTVIKTVGLSAAVLAGALLLILLGMYIMYKLGYNRKEKEDTTFMRDVLDRVKSR